MTDRAPARRVDSPLERSRIYAKGWGKLPAMKSQRLFGGVALRSRRTQRLRVCMGTVILAAALAPEPRLPTLRAFASGLARRETLAEAQLTGRVVCLAEEMNQLYEAGLPTKHEHLYGFKTVEGRFYTLLRTKYSEALFLDEALRERELILKGRVFLAAQVMEVFNIRSTHDGVVYDVYYYCDVCAIKQIMPGPCECCRQPVVLTEKPLAGPR